MSDQKNHLEPNAVPLSLQQAINKHLVASMPHLLAVYLFGSYATKYKTEESDIDIAVLSRHPLTAVGLWETAQQLALDLKCNVDLINLQEASTVFRYQILMTGKRIYCSDPKRCDAIENCYLSMYLRLQEERHEIIKDLLQKWRRNT